MQKKNTWVLQPGKMHLTEKYRNMMWEVFDPYGGYKVMADKKIKACILRQQ